MPGKKITNWKKKIHKMVKKWAKKVDMKIKEFLANSKNVPPLTPALPKKNCSWNAK